MELTILKHPREKSLKSHCNLLVVNSVNHYLDRLSADVYEGNITYDVLNCISYIHYNTILIFNNVSNHQKMQYSYVPKYAIGTMHHNGARCSMYDFYFFSHCSTPSKYSTKIYVMKDVLRNVHVKYGCGHSRT